MIQLLALALLACGVLLEAAGVAFWGLDLLVGLCLGGAVVLAAVSILGGRSLAWGLVTAVLGSLALALHVCLVMDLL